MSVIASKQAVNNTDNNQKRNIPRMVKVNHDDLRLYSLHYECFIGDCGA